MELTPTYKTIAALVLSAGVLASVLGAAPAPVPRVIVKLRCGLKRLVARFIY